MKNYTFEAGKALERAFFRVFERNELGAGAASGESYDYFSEAGTIGDRWLIADR